MPGLTALGRSAPEGPAVPASMATPSDFMTVALERALQQREIIAKERQDAQGYMDHPQQPEEIAEWQDEQDWGEP